MKRQRLVLPAGVWCAVLRAFPVQHPAKIDRCRHLAHHDVVVDVHAASVT